MKEVLMMRKLLALAVGIGAVLVGVAAMVRYTRFGSGYVNEVVNPYLVRRGLSGSGPSEIGTLEHVGRRSGTRRLTPLHPVRTENGFRFVVPLGERSEWVQNVVAAGHCRMQLHDVVYELDEPVVLAASELPDIAPPVAWVLDRIGAEYLLLRTFADAPGQLAPGAEDETAVDGEPATTMERAEVAAS
jgi:deazaflavin-dependent oxidoreductase (nitroreductase family)